MKSSVVKGSLILLAMILFLGWGLGTGQAQEDVTIQEENLPPDILNVLNEEFGNPDNPGVQGVQFRDLTLNSDEAAELFFSPDPDSNLLRQIGGTLKDEEQVKFRGTVDGQRFDARVERHEDGLRARIEGMDVSAMTPEELADFLSNGFDRVRIQGSGGERYEIRRHDDGTLRAKIEGMDIGGMTPEQFTDFATKKGFDHLRIRGSDGQRYEIKRQGDGTLRARLERMDLSNRDPKEVLESLREKGLDRVRIRGVDADGNRVRIEYRADKGIVEWEGAGRGLWGTSSEINDDHARDRGRDRDHRNRWRERAERLERFYHDDHGARIERWRDRIQGRLRDHLERRP